MGQGLWGGLASCWACGWYPVLFLSVQGVPSELVPGQRGGLFLHPVLQFCLLASSVAMLRSLASAGQQESTRPSCPGVRFTQWVGWAGLLGSCWQVEVGAPWSTHEWISLLLSCPGPSVTFLLSFGSQGLAAMWDSCWAKAGHCPEAAASPRSPCSRNVSGLSEPLGLAQQGEGVG